MGRSDNYRFGLLAHPGRSKGAARYDVGLLAHRHSRPALTETSPTGSPYPELPSLPSPDLPVQQPLAAHRHTRYDALGRITQVTDNNDPNDANDNSTVDWTYTREADGDLRVEETQGYGNMTDRTVTTTYDLSGRLKELDYPSSLTLGYTYDDAGRAVTVDDGTNDLVDDTWKGHLLQKREYHSGAYLTHLDDSSSNLSGYGYDAFGRIKNHRWKDSGGTLIAGWHHDYDRVGNKDYQEDLKDSTESELYGYDAVYRLDEFDRGQLNQAKDDISSPTRTQTWTLDPLGNWDQTVVDSTTESRTHNDVNELTQRTIGQDPSISLTYDDAGNLTQDGDSDGDHKYTWDYRNRLIEVEEKQSGAWNTVAEYKYDGRTRRILKVVTNKGDLNGTTRFVWGGDSDWQCLEERDGSGDLVARFTYAPGYIDAVARQERDLNSDDDFADDDEVVWYHTNTLYSVYALTDGNENVVERYRYDAYGACTVLDSDFSSDADNASDVANPYAFTARRLDAESALMQYRHRYYKTHLGRFVSRDPILYGGGLNLYAYAVSNPVANNDPTGLKCTTWKFRNAFANCQGRISGGLLGDLCPKVTCDYRKKCWDSDSECPGEEDNVWFEHKRVVVSAMNQIGQHIPCCFVRDFWWLIPLPSGTCYFRGAGKSMARKACRKRLQSPNPQI